MNVPVELHALLEALGQLADGSALPEPPFIRSETQSEEDWLRSIDAARTAHDRFAQQRHDDVETLAHREMLLTALLDIPAGASVEQSHLKLEVPTGMQLVDVEPALAGVTPVGAAARTTQASAPVTLTLTRDLRDDRSRSCVLRLHGGAFWMGGGATSAKLDRVLSRYLALRLGAVVVDIDYRLAPEHPFPAPIVDALLSLDLVRERAASLGIDPAKIAVIGTSSGGNIATALVQADAARSTAPEIAALGLIVPSVDLTSAPATMRDNAAAWSARQRQIGAYLGDVVAPSDPWVSPALLTELAGMPPTFAIVAEHDDVARGAEQLCAAIVEGGGDARWRRYPMTHTVAVPSVEAAMLRDLGDFLAARLGS